MGLPMLHLGKDEVPTAILKGKKVDPKEVVADRRKSPGPGEYPITQQLQVKKKLYGKSNEKFDSNQDRFKNSPFDLPSRSTEPTVGPGAYKQSDEV